MPTLIDGREVDSASPEWAMECLARHVLAIKPLAARREWLEGYDKKDAAGGQKLRQLMTAIKAK